MRHLTIIFVGFGAEQLGISQLSAIARRDGHKVGIAFSPLLFHDRRILDFPFIAEYFDDTKQIVQTIHDQKPDVLAFSPITSTYKWMLKVASQAKEVNPKIKTVFGGVHPSAVSDLVIARQQVDYVVVGEGDEAFPQILKQISQGDYSTPIFNTRYKDKNGIIIIGRQKSFLQDLDSLPFFDKILWEDHVRLGDLYQTLGSRGCPNRCAFCFNNFYANLPDEKGCKYVRFRSVDHIIGELKIAKRRYKIHEIDFYDDIFASNIRWLEEFSWKYRKEINIPYYIFTHPRYLNEHIVTLLKESGCEWIQMGLQSVDESYKREKLMRNEKMEDVEFAVNLMKKFGIPFSIDHMLALPEEPMDAQEKARLFYAKAQPKRINTFWTSYLPGTQMLKEAEENNMITPEQVKKINEGEAFSFFRSTENLIDKAIKKKYKAYEMIFRIMPCLPARLKTVLTLRKISFFPVFLLNPLSFLIDLTIGLYYRKNDFTSYALHNMYHLRKFFAAKIGIKIRPATKIKENIDFADTDFHNNQSKDEC